MRVKRIIPAGRADVYNMEVDETHDFVVQGGAVVHNCADEVRYMCMSRPIKPRISVPRDTFAESDVAIALDLTREDLTPRTKRVGLEIIGKG